MNRSSLEPLRGFPLWSSVLVVLSVVALLYAPGLPAHWRSAAAYGLLISGTTSVSGYIIMRRASRASNSTFIKLLLGGLVGRLFAALGAVAAGIAWLGLAPAPLATACLGCYVLLSIFEYYSLLKTLTEKR